MKRRPPSNPVHGAVVRAKLNSAVRDLKIGFLIAETGDDATDNLAELALVLTPICVGGMAQHGREQPWVRVLHGALRTLQAMCLNDYRWDRTYAPALENALDLALAHMPSIETRFLVAATQQGYNFADLIKAHQVTPNTVASTP